MSRPDTDDLEALRARLELAEAVRDTAVAELERERAQAASETELLSAEQDRFVSHVLERHERELGKLRGEADEASAVADQSSKKLARARRLAAAIEEDLARSQCQVEVLLKERDRLVAELDMARSMLGDAMDSAPRKSNHTWTATQAPLSSAPTTSPGESRIVGRPENRWRRRSPSGAHSAYDPRVTPPPRRIAINEVPGGSEPPKSSE